MVTLTDPVGHKVHLIHGQSPQQDPRDPQLEKLTLNYEDEKPRKGWFQRFEPGSAKHSAPIPFKPDRRGNH